MTVKERMKAIRQEVTDRFEQKESEFGGEGLLLSLSTMYQTWHDVVEKHLTEIDENTAH